jgi:hypothetical protein
MPSIPILALKSPGIFICYLGPLWNTHSRSSQMFSFRDNLFISIVVYLETPTISDFMALNGRMPVNNYLTIIRKEV